MDGRPARALLAAKALNAEIIQQLFVSSTFSDLRVEADEAFNFLLLFEDIMVQWLNIRCNAKFLDEAEADVGEFGEAKKKVSRGCSKP